MSNQVPVAILAGGLATRLGEISRDTPKSLLDVNGRPFLAWQLELLVKQGVTDVVLCLGHRAGQIREVFAGGEAYGLRIRYSFDGDDPLAQLDGQVWKHRALEAIKRMLLRESLNQPVMVIFEDLHWIDSRRRSS